VPGSKSLTNRALLLAALAEGTTTLTGVLFADDTRRMLEALPKLGVDLEVDESAEAVRVAGLNGACRGQGTAERPVELFLGNAGTATRFLTAACTLGQGIYRIDGVERMRQRPIGQLVEPLRQLGARIEHPQAEGFPPLVVYAGMDRAATDPGFRVRIAPTLSSQYISALMMIGPCLPAGLALDLLPPVTSLPYVHMTRRLMERFGAEAEMDHREAWGGPLAMRIPPTGYRAREEDIEPDASSATYFLAAAAIGPAGSSCTVQGLTKDSLQGDVNFADILGALGAQVVYGPDGITVSAPPADQPLQATDVHMGEMPDAAMTLAVVALFARGTTAIRGLGNLRVKETDRLTALKTELNKLGAYARVQGDDLIISPPPTGELTPATVQTYDDHRMAMSFALAGLRQEGVVIHDPACCGKTYPDFFEDLQRLRASSASS
jgi:3-phosphoshikimate 1-carboxyvinyltransferase